MRTGSSPLKKHKSCASAVCQIALLKRIFMWECVKRGNTRKTAMRCFKLEKWDIKTKGWMYLFNSNEVNLPFFVSLALTDSRLLLLLARLASSSFFSSAHEALRETEWKGFMKPWCGITQQLPWWIKLPLRVCSWLGTRALKDSNCGGLRDRTAVGVLQCWRPFNYAKLNLFDTLANTQKKHTLIIRVFTRPWAALTR